MRLLRLLWILVTNRLIVLFAGIGLGNVMAGSAPSPGVFWFILQVGLLIAGLAGIGLEADLSPFARRIDTAFPPLAAAVLALDMMISIRTPHVAMLSLVGANDFGVLGFGVNQLIYKITDARGVHRKKDSSLLNLTK
ncbi:MAG TPA: hypothetical protein VD837_19495 [Terriglobales bacterium]|nr:hypothetical protein [Terriglobales bacterium]